MHQIKGELNSRSRFGFSLLEVLIVLAIVGGLALITIPFLSTRQMRNELDQAALDLVSHLRRAQSKASYGYFNSEWGIEFKDQTYTLYRGSSFALRDVAYDEIYTIAKGVSQSNSFMDNVYFTRQGQATRSGYITLTDSYGNTKRVVIFPHGLIEIEL